MPLTDYQWKRIIALWTETEGKLPWTTLERMLALEGLITTRQTIKRTITRWQNNGSTVDSPQSRPSRKVPEDHIQCINDAMADNNELTAEDFKDIPTKKFGPHRVCYGERTIARIRNELGWTTAYHSKILPSHSQCKQRKTVGLVYRAHE